MGTSSGGTSKSISSPSTASVNATTSRRKSLALTGLSLGYFMVLLDTTIVTVALPAIHSDMGGSFTSLEWVVNAYTVLFASLLLNMGSLSDRYGAKRIFSGGLILFAAASALSSSAHSLGLLILLRGLLGMGGAAMTSASLALIASIYQDDAKKRTQALGIFASVSGVALAAGPVIGGLLVDWVGWRSIFLMNLPIAVLSLLLIIPCVRETHRNTGRSLDLAGQLTSTLFFLSLTFALVEGNSLGWGSNLVTSAFVAAVASLLLFAFIEVRSKSPMLPMRLLRQRSISAGLAAGLAVNFGLSGCLFVLTFFFQQHRGYSALLTGLAFLPLTFPMMANPMFTSRIVNRVGVRIPMICGFFVTAVGAAILTAASGASYWLLSIGLFFFGYGLSLTIPPLVTSVVSAAPPGQAGVASGALNSVRQLGAALGVAILSLFMYGTGNPAEIVTSTAGVSAALLASVFVLAGGGIVTLLFIGKQ